MNNFKLYIARDEGKWDEGVQTTGGTKPVL